MKKLITFLLLLVSGFGNQLVKAQDVFTPYQTFLGLGTGINNSCGLLGVGLEQFVSDRYTILGAAGIGTWGYKVTGGARYYLEDTKKGAAFGLSYSYSGGINEMEQDVEIEKNGIKSTVTEQFKMLPVSTLNLTWTRFWYLGQKSRLNLELGYSINLSGRDNFESVSKPFLTDKSRSLINMLQPGGLIIGLGLSFGL